MADLPKILVILGAGSSADFGVPGQFRDAAEKCRLEHNADETANNRDAGLYLVAVELTRRGLVVSPTSRSAFGADLLVTDQKCKRAWSVQVKTNAGRATFWLLNKHSREVKSDMHIYVLVNLGQKNPRQKLSPPDFYVVPSRVLTRRMPARVNDLETGAHII